jgi:hypothetical protein
MSTPPTPTGMMELAGAIERTLSTHNRHGEPGFETDPLPNVVDGLYKLANAIEDLTNVLKEKR